MLTRITLAAIAVAACGPASVPPDAAVDEDVQCLQSTKTVTAADGSKSVTDDYFAEIPMSPNDDYRIEFCGVLRPGASDDCPPASVCRHTGEQIPVGDRCAWQNGGGTYIAGKLEIFCGSIVTTYMPNGAVIGTTGQRWRSIRVHR